MGNWSWLSEVRGRNLSSNKALPWSGDFIERYQDRWDWPTLSVNEGIPWSIELVERFKDKWDWQMLSLNDAIPWSIDLLERYAGRLEWHYLPETGSFKVPKLKPEDIIRIMSGNFEDRELLASGSLSG